MILTKIEEKIFLIRKISIFWPSNPYLWGHYFLFLTFPKWSFSQVKVQLRSYNLSQRATLSAIEVDLIALPVLILMKIDKKIMYSRL